MAPFPPEVVNMEANGIYQFLEPQVMRARAAKHMFVRLHSRCGIYATWCLEFCHCVLQPLTSFAGKPAVYEKVLFLG